jgi:hypothetical protein
VAVQRQTERALARMGHLVEAAPQFVGPVCRDRPRQ